MRKNCFWSDPGWHLGEKEHWQKATLWERATRVHLIITAPGFETGQTCDRPVSLVDLFPTLLDLCDLPSLDKNDGQSLEWRCFKTLLRRKTA